MGVLLVSTLRSLRETLCKGLVASGFPGRVEAVGLECRLWRQSAQPPAVLFVSSAAAEGIRLVAEFRAMHPATVVGVLALTHRDEEFIAWAGSGISGYVEPDATTDGIVATIGRLAEGEIIYPPRLSSLLLNRFAQRSIGRDPQGGLAELTRRELQVIELLADGQANKQIARRLNITEATAKNHVHSILEKLNLRSRGQAAAWFRRSSFGQGPAGHEIMVRALGAGGEPAESNRLGS